MASHPLTAHFDALNRERFSGRLDVHASGHSRPWSVYFYLGRIFYATGGTQTLKRWKRLFAEHCPNLELQRLTGLISAMASNSECWEYQLLGLLIERGLMGREQAIAIIRACIDEVMFDMLQGGRLTCKLYRSNTLTAKLMVITTDQALENLHRMQQQWKATGVSAYSLNDAPVIRLPEQLQRRVPEAVYRTISTWLDGKRSLRDLAVSMRQNVFSLTRSLAPYIQEGIIELVEVFDVPAASVATPIQPPAPQASPDAPLVACVDDSPQVCQMMEEILKGAGYRIVTLQDPLRAIVTLLQCKPDLIFLDLVMPNTSGYEICSRLRKAAAFQNVPIVILTGNDGIIDRVRAKVVGSSDFMGKPVVAEAVLAMAQKHLSARLSLHQR